MFFFFNDTATTEIYTLSLHDALPIFPPTGEKTQGSRARGNRVPVGVHPHQTKSPPRRRRRAGEEGLRARSRAGHSGFLDRKSTRLNSSHANISYAVFCLKKKKLTLLS